MSSDLDPIRVPLQRQTDIRRRAAELRPGLRSLLMSGEGNPAPGGDPTIPPGKVCLPKPFHLGKLLEAVADALAPAHNP